MKLRILLPILVLILMSDTYAQKHKSKEKIGSVGAYQMGYAECIIQNNVYLFTYENQNEVQVNNYDEFSINLEDFEKVYEALMDGFKDKHKKKMHIPTTSKYVEMEYAKVFGIVQVRFTQSHKKGALGVSLSAYYSQKEIKKLFGKK